MTSLQRLIYIFLIAGTGLACSLFSPVESPTARPTNTLLPAASPDKPTGTQPPTAATTPVSTTLQTLLDTVVPVKDPVDIARRLQGLDEQVNTPESPLVEYQRGDTEEFWVVNNDTAELRQLTARLEYITPHVYFWIEEGIRFDSQDVRRLSETFETEIYPTNRAFFGSEWTPGVDGDEHIFIVLAKGIGRNVAGMFSSSDQVPSQVVRGSNGHEMFFLSGDNIDLADEFTYSVLAHEFQHMIHWNLDRNETSWINEGFSEVAQRINNYTVGFLPQSYLSNPDLQLNDWPDDGNSGANYGASFLFLTYFLDRFGEETTQALVAHLDNGMASIDAVLTELDVRDPLTGGLITADQVVLEWALTNYIGSESVLDGRFSYQDYFFSSGVSPTESQVDCQPGLQTRRVHQYGVDYIHLECGDSVTLEFGGDLETNLVPAGAHSGDYAFWSNKGDQSDMTLTRTFDFRDHEGPLTLEFWTWFDIETDWDYVYVLASTDGERWDFLKTPSGTNTDPSGNNYEWGLTGLSGGIGEWILESVDISPYAGKEVQLRFEYITDTAVNGEGMLIDDIAVPEVGYFSDLEDGDGGWTAEGFARVTNLLPQTFQVALITLDSGMRVDYLPLDAANRLTLELDFSAGQEYVLVVVGTTRFTRQVAEYWFDFLR